MNKFHCLILFSLFYTSTLIGQSESLEINSIETYAQHILSTESGHAPTFYEEDLLIAQRNDVDSNGEFIGIDSLEFNYGVNENLLSVFGLRWDGISWNPYQNDIFDYDTSGNRIISLSQIYVDGSFVNERQTNRVFDSNNNLTSSIRDEWDNGVWISNQKLEYTYNEENQLTNYIRYRFDYDWIPVFSYSYEYNSEGLETVEFTDSWTGTDWAIDKKENTYYNADNNIIEIDRRDWNGSDWIPFLRFVNEYDDNSLFIKQSLYRAPEGEYINWLQYCVNHNADGTVSDQTFLEWIDDEWLNEYYETFNYDDRENRIYKLRQYWDIEDSTWVDAFQNFYYYRFVSSTNSLVQEEHNLYILPNPNNGTFDLSIEGITEKAQLSVFTNTGQQVYHSDFINWNKSINLNQLPAGSYYLKLRTEEKSWMKKFIIQQ